MPTNPPADPRPGPCGPDGPDDTEGGEATTDAPCGAAASAGGGAASGDRAGRARRVVVDPGGPVLVEGPVEVALPDGRVVRSDRFMVALCACRRSEAYPWCDTSHRRRRAAR